eukprot:TRINITY_DN11285_c3_g1_i1.p1 TRINITY_DN11285_c3_g1~~TRINITY_DN11285_c3_g1_i1.p1  ORF type:complete len:1075 (+),score=373.04 TRINITY_DN11285_c3_g1_i1:93-3317(+)
MAGLPWELYNARNRELADQLTEKEARLQRVREELAQAALERDAQQQRAEALRKEAAEREGRQRATEAEAEAERRLLAVAAREASRVEEEARRCDDEEAALQRQLELVTARVEEAAGRVAARREAAEQDEGGRAALQAAARELEDRASLLGSVSAEDARRLAALFEQRDKVEMAVAAARDELRAESAEADVVNQRIAGVERDMAAETREKADVLRSCEEIKAQLEMQDKRAESLAAAKVANEERARALEAARSRAAATAAELQRDNAEVASQVEAAARKRDALPADLKAKEAALGELDTEAETCRRAMERALEDLYALRAELRAAQQELTERRARLVELQGFREEAAEALRQAEGSADDDTLVQHGIDRLRSSAERSLAQAARRLQAAVAQLHQSMELQAQEHRRSEELRCAARAAEGASRRRAAELSQGNAQHSAAEERVAELRAAEQSKRAALAVAQAGARADEAQLAARARAMAEELDAVSREHAALLLRRTSARQTLSATFQQGELRAAEAEQLRRLIEDAELELRAIADEMQRQNAVRRERRLALDMFGADEARMREAAERALRGAGQEQRRRDELDQQIAERERAVQEAVLAQRQELRTAEEERRELAAELQRKQQALTLLRVRYDEAMRLLYSCATGRGPDDDGPEEGDAVRLRDEEIAELEPEQLLARALCGQASSRQALQEQGDALDAAVVAAEKESRRIDRAHRLLFAQAGQGRRPGDAIAWKDPTTYELAAPATDEGERGRQELAEIRARCGDLRGRSDEAAAALAVLDARLQAVQLEHRQRRAALADAQQRQRQLSEQAGALREALQAAGQPPAPQQRRVSAGGPLRGDPAALPAPAPAAHAGKAPEALRRLHQWALRAAAEVGGDAAYHAYRRLLDRAGLQPPLQAARRTPQQTPLSPQPQQQQPERRERPSSAGGVRRAASAGRAAHTPPTPPRQQPGAGLRADAAPEGRGGRRVTAPPLVVAPAAWPQGPPAAAAQRTGAARRGTAAEAAPQRAGRPGAPPAAAAGLGWAAGAPPRAGAVGRRSSSQPAVPPGAPRVGRAPPARGQPSGQGGLRVRGMSF